MPHVILEHSNNIEDKINYHDLFKKILDLIIDLDIVLDPSNVKSRFIKSDEYHLGNNNEIFIHLEISLLGGRDRNKLKSLGDKTKELLSESFPLSKNSHKDSFSVEIREINRELYFY